MDQPCLRFAPALAVSLLVGLMSAAGVGQERAEPPPTDAAINKQIRRLEQGNPEAERLEAVKWLQRHAQAKNAHVAVPALERCIRTDPAANVRDAAVLTLAWIAKHRHQACPLAIVEAMLDKDVFVSQSADAFAEWFKTFPQGSVELLLRCAESQDDNRRGRCLIHLARAGGKDKKVLKALAKAKQDKSFGVRHNAHVALFRATDNLEEFLAYLIRLQEDPDAALGRVDARSEAGKRERATRDLAILASALLVAEWSEKRPDDLAPALLKLLAAPSPLLRRGAARLIGASAIKVDLAVEGREKPRPPPEATEDRKPPQKSQAAARLEKLGAEDRLRKLTESDPDRTVRGAAQVALERLATVREKGSSR